jgi:hypothetical protein
MAITTTDVCTNVVAGNEVSNNGTIIVSCLPTGSYKKIDSVFETSITYNNLENKLTNRFDDVTTIVGA